ALLVANLVAEVRAFLARVPDGLLGVDRVERPARRVLVADRVEDEELRLRAEERGVGDAARLEVILSLLGDMARIAPVGLPGHRIADLADHAQRPVRAERIDPRGGRIRSHGHVARVDRLPAAHRRSVEPDPILEEFFVEAGRWDRGVLPDAREVNEL